MIVGFGRVGGALALGLQAAEWDVAVLPRSADSVRRAASLRVFLADHDDLRAAQLCLLAVPDSAVVPAMELVEEDLGPNTALVHCSGALPLSVFASTWQVMENAGDDGSDGSSGSPRPNVIAGDARSLLLIRTAPHHSMFNVAHMNVAESQILLNWVVSFEARR